MCRFAPLLVLFVGGVASGLAQSKGVQWQTDPDKAVAEARQAKKPVMFYVLAGTEFRDQHIENAQRRAWADPRVIRLAQRFVPVKLSRSRDRALLPQIGLRETSNMEIAFIAPEPDVSGKAHVIDTLGAQGVGDPGTLAQKMALVFNFYRQQLFDQELRPILENKDAKPEAVRAALLRIREYTIVGADASVGALLDREKLDAKIAALCYDVLAELSTKISVQKLLDLSAKGTRPATEALTKCTPAAAEMMLDQWRTDEGATRLDVYHAITKICGITNVRPDRWWEKSPKPRQDDEVKRVEGLVRKASERWKKDYAEYR
jgi:hypothetical protein